MSYPEHIHGDPDSFPTYYNVRFLRNRIKITYMLFFPFDFKDDDIGSELLANHRGDWVGVSAVLNQMEDRNLFEYDPNIVNSASIDYIIYGGHGPRRYIDFSSPNLFKRESHPLVFIAWGNHATYPVPGEFHNYKAGICAISWVDDYFRGDGLVTKSWITDDRLINVGEVDSPMPGKNWLRYKGLWGRDITFFGYGASSPGGPSSKIEWKSDKNNEDYKQWESLVEDEMDGKWCGELKYLDQIPLTLGCDGWYADDGPIAIFWDQGPCETCDSWDGEPNLLSGPAEYPNMVDIAGGNLQSVLLLGGTEVHLFDEQNFKGDSMIIQSSTPHFDFDVNSLRVYPKNVNKYVCDIVVTKDISDSESIGNWLDPLDRISEAVEICNPNDVLCIKSGNYDENLIISKPLMIRSIGGVVQIGK